MTVQHEVKIDGTSYAAVLSDDPETLSAAKAAGRVSVAILRESCRESRAMETEYALELPENPEEDYQEKVLIPYLERVIRRHLNLPWNICETKRLTIREFSIEDAGQIPKEETDTSADAVFYTPELLDAYIKNQYRFYEYGVWALVRKADGMIVGTAGLTQWEGPDGWPDQAEGQLKPEEDFSLELGYHIFLPYRRQGYGEEACRGILSWAKEEYDCPVRAKVKPDNTASVRLLEKLGIPYWKI